MVLVYRTLESRLRWNLKGVIQIKKETGGGKGLEEEMMQARGHENGLQTKVDLS